MLYLHEVLAASRERRGHPLASETLVIDTWEGGVLVLQEVRFEEIF